MGFQPNIPFPLTISFSLSTTSSSPPPQGHGIHDGLDEEDEDEPN